jgi:hypothetical protein
MRNRVKGAWLLGFVCFGVREGLDMRFLGGKRGFFIAGSAAVSWLGGLVRGIDKRHGNDKSNSGG